MTASPLAGGLLGAGVGVGLLVVVAGWLGLLDQPRRPARRALARRTARRVDQLTWRLGLAFGGFALAGWWTRWPAAMGACAVLGWLTPSCIGLRVRRRRQVARSEAVASWAEMLRDLLVSNAGLHEAIGKSARVAPAAIRDEVKALYVRTQRGELAPALARFADEMDDGVADTVVTALQIADQRAVSDLGQMLTAVATSTRETVAMQLRIDAARARVYRTAQLIAAIVAFFVGALVVTNPEYLEPFGSAGGQVVLALVAGVVGVAVWAMVALSRPVRAPRLLRVGTATRRTVGG